MLIIHMIIGSGMSVVSASQGSIEIRMAAVMRIIRTSLAKSSKCSERKRLMRSVSLPMRAIRSPVRLPPKYCSESVCRCVKVVVRRPAPMRSLTQASK